MSTKNQSRRQSTGRMRLSVSVLAGLSVLAVAACSEQSRDALAPSVQSSHNPNHGGGKGPPSQDPDPEVNVTFTGGLGVSDDGAGTYVSGECGASGRIWVGGSEDVTMTPAKDWDSGLGCAQRFFVVDLTNGTAGENLGISTSSHLAVIALNLLPDDGAFYSIPAQFLGPDCDILRYDSGSTAATKVNRKAPYTSNDVWARAVAHSSDPSKRAWQVQTLNPTTGQQDDVASCINPGKGPTKQLDGQFHVPFSMLIEEQ